VLGELGIEFVLSERDLGRQPEGKGGEADLLCRRLLGDKVILSSLGLRGAQENGWCFSEVLLADPQRYSRYLLVLVRVLEIEEVRNLGFSRGTNLVKIMSARDMNQGQRRY
jgi:hypothetical protein